MTRLPFKHLPLLALVCVLILNLALARPLRPVHLRTGPLAMRRSSMERLDHGLPPNLLKRFIEGTDGASRSGELFGSIGCLCAILVLIGIRR